MNYSKELIEEAKKRGMSQVEIAEVIGTAKTWITKVKSGDKRLAEEHVIKLAKALGIDQEQALVKLQIETAKTDEERRLWAKLLKTLVATSALVSASANAVITNCVQCILC